MNTPPIVRQSPPVAARVEPPPKDHTRELAAIHETAANAGDVIHGLAAGFLLGLLAGCWLGPMILMVPLSCVGLGVCVGGFVGSWRSFIRLAFYVVIGGLFAHTLFWGMFQATQLQQRLSEIGR